MFAAAKLGKKCSRQEQLGSICETISPHLSKNLKKGKGTLRCFITALDKHMGVENLWKKQNENNSKRVYNLHVVKVSSLVNKCDHRKKQAKSTEEKKIKLHFSFYKLILNSTNG